MNLEVNFSFALMVVGVAWVWPASRAMKAYLIEADTKHLKEQNEQKRFEITAEMSKGNRGGNEHGTP